MLLTACKKSLLLSLLFFAIINVNAQQSIPIFFEKVYLHTDRSFYAAGDNIWFKAYTINTRTNTISTASNNLYVELFAANGLLLKRNTIRLEDGIGKGDFKLLDSAIGGTYHIRAYTNWMKNFGNHFFFEKDILVTAVTTASTNASKSPTKNSSTKNTDNASQVNSIQFFPEGGTLVANTPAVLSFKALNVLGKSIDATGVILSEKGDTISKFSTTHAGMGSCTFTPLADIDYKAMVVFKDGTKSVVDLPSVYEQGYVLSITHADTNIVATISANQITTSANPSKEILLAARNTGKLFYKEKIAMINGKATVVIGKSSFPNGITSITVYDDKLRPNAERLVYVEHKNQQYNLTVTTDQTVYQSKDKVTVTVTTTNASNEPVAANLSFAAVDESMLQSTNTDIVSYTFLESEIKGNIENATAYFNPKNTQRLQQLDLLLRTQGWRNFLWRQIADTTYSIKFLPEAGISLSGKVQATFGKKLLPNMNITLIAPGAKGSKLYFTQTDSTGKYYLDGLPLYGTQSIKINSKNDKGKKGGIIELDSLNKASTNFLSVTTQQETKELTQFSEEAKKRWATEKKNLEKDVTMPGVVVNANTKPKVNRDGSVESNFGYSFAAQIKPEDKQFGTLDNYLIHKTSAVADVEMEGVNYQVNGKLVRPRFVVDNREDFFERIDYYAIPVDQIVSVKLNQVVANANGSFVDRIVINLVLKPGAYNQDLALLMTEIDGYYEARTFYAPTYFLNSEKIKPDVRTTLFWEPRLQTNANGKTTVTFFNADPKANIKIYVQGVVDKGTPIAGTTQYKIQ